MPSLSDFRLSGASLLPWNVIDNAMGVITLDYSQFSGYRIAQGAGDLTLNFNTDPSIYMPLGKLILSLNQAYTLTINDSNIDSILLPGSVNSARNSNIQFDIQNEDSSPSDVFFKPDGTKMYMMGTSSDSIYQYTLSTPWDLTTASYDSVSLNVQSQDFSPEGMTFKFDGLTLYMIGTGSDSVHQYSLTTAWDLSTAVYDSVSLNVQAQESSPRDLFFKTDGSKMFVIGSSSDSVHQYSLTTAWDLSTAVYDSVSLNVQPQDSTPMGLFFKSDGKRMFMVGSNNQSIYQYTLTSAWDLTTASYDAVSFKLDIEPTEWSPEGIFFKPDLSKMYIIGNSNDVVYQFNLPEFVLNDVFQFGPDISVEATANQTNAYT